MKKIWIILFAVTTAACAKEKPVAGDRLVLGDGWTLKSAAVSQQFTASVPSTVAGTLYEAGYFGGNLLEARNYEKVDKAVFDDTWTYSTTFAGKPGRG